MDINLETCIIGFLIGVALYFLVNRVFMLEGMRPKKRSHRKKSPSSSPAPSPSPSPPPSKTLTQDELKLKGIIEAAIRAEEDMSLVNDESYFSTTPEIQNSILSGLPEHSVISLLFIFKDTESLNNFKKLLDNNNNNSLVNSEDEKPIILMFDYLLIGPQFGKYTYANYDLTYMRKIANCFKGNIIGIKTTDSKTKGDLGSLSGFKKLQYLDLNGTSIEGDLGSLSGLQGLQYLDLQETKVNGLLSNLSGLNDLQYLDLVGQQANIKGNLGSLSGLKELKGLYLNGANIKGNLSDLRALKKLQAVGLISDGINGNLGSLSGLKELQYLDLNGANIKGNLGSLSKLNDLDYLFLCPNPGIKGNISDTPAIYNAYQNGNTDLKGCIEVIE